MRKSLPILIVLLFCFALPSLAQNEKLISRISKEICNCLEKYENIQTQPEIEAAMENCIMKSSMKNLDAIKRDLGIDMTKGESSGRQFGEVIAYEMIRKCEVFLKYIMMVSTAEPLPGDTIGEGYKETSFYNEDLVPYERFSTDTMTVDPGACLAVRNAKFTYVTDNPEKVDYFVLDQKTCVEHHDNEKYISHYHIKWKSDCEYESTFVDSTNPEINNLLSKGDKIRYQIIGVYGSTVYLNLDYKGFSKIFIMSIQK